MKLLIVVLLAASASCIVTNKAVNTNVVKKPIILNKVCNSDFIRVHCKDSPMITASYWYNATTNLCEKKSNYFVQCAYRGNNFPTLASCEAKCQAGPGRVHVENLQQYKNGVCRLPHASNEGFNLECLAKSYLAWSYDSETNSCEKFTYTGCGGNDNRFHTEKDCLTTCSLPSIPKPTLSKSAKRAAINSIKTLHPVCKMEFKRHFCHESPITSISYWYNVMNNKCEKKYNYYLSCANLGNNFPNKWSCERKCKIN